MTRPSPWHWRTEGRDPTLWRLALPGLRALLGAVPWITVALLLLMFELISNRLTVAEGVLFDLPSAAPIDVASESMLAMVLPKDGESLVFFDGARYTLGSGDSERSLVDMLRQRAEVSRDRTLVVLADRRISAGDLARLAHLAREGRVERMLLANRRGGRGVGE